MAITVHLRNGQSPIISNAVTAENAIESSGGQPLAILRCKDADGKTVGEFMLDQVSGWSQPPPPRTTAI